MKEENVRRLRASKPRVCHILSSFRPLIGGAERAVENLSRGLISQGYPVHVLTSWYPGLNRTEAIDTIPISRLGLAGPGKLRALSFGLHTAWWMLRHGHSVPIIHTQNTDTPLLVGILVKLLSPYKRWVVTFQGEQNFVARRQTRMGRLRLALMRSLADHYIALTEAMRQLMLDQGIPSERITLIPNPVDVDHFCPPRPDQWMALRAQQGYGPDDIVVLYLGRLIWSKRVDLLLRALAAIVLAGKVRCLIVGGGDQEGTLRSLAAELGLGEQVHFTGPVDNVRDFYWMSDLYILPTMTEGLPVALLESMACGMAVLVTKHPGNLQVVTDGTNGLTCNLDDLSDLSRQLARLVQDPVLRRTLGSEARKSMLAKYSVETVVEAHLNVYAQVI